jgi:monothiol glutaredoxin
MRFAGAKGRGPAYDCNKERKRQDRAWQLPGNLLYYTTVSGYSYANWRVARGPLNVRLYAYGYKDVMMGIKEFIENELKSNDVVLFMKGTPQFPQCGFSGQVVQILDHVGVGYKGLNVLESPDLRDGIKTYSSWPTIPQLYVKGEFVGGCDIVREMFQAGELQKLFSDKGITFNAPASA